MFRISNTVITTAVISYAYLTIWAEYRMIAKERLKKTSSIPFTKENDVWIKCIGKMYKSYKVMHIQSNVSYNIQNVFTFEDRKRNTSINQFFIFYR